MKVHHLVMLLCLGALPFSAQATVYKKSQDDGQAIYSDTPSFGGRKVELSPLDEYTSRPVGQGRHDTDQYSVAETPVVPPWQYQHINVIRPEALQTFHNIGGSLPVEFEIQPQLYTGDALVILVDGVAVVHQVETSPVNEDRNAINTAVRIGMTLQQIHRGEHTLQAQIHRDGQSISASQSVKIFVQQATIATSKN